VKKRIVTGDRPTGKLHLGHYTGSLKSRLLLQENSEYEQFVMIADMQALTDNFNQSYKIKSNIYEVVRDYLSIGLDPNKTTIFIQSQVKAISELTMYYLNLVSIAKLERNPTIKIELAQKKFNSSIPAGFLCYPINQAADITIFQGEVVPVGSDQLPMIEQTNEIVSRFNRIYNTNCLKKCTAYISPFPKLMGIDGQHKASKSLNNAIFLSDTEGDIKEKVKQMYTDPSHIHISSPGKVEGNVVFAYLEAFHPDKQEVEELKNQYRKGGLGDMTLKNILNKTLQELLCHFREKRAKVKDEEIASILEAGSHKANKIAEETMQQVRAAVGTNYFIS
jgi:tryptophanyl-tRNA synthetase